ncbi:MAG: TonB-dependent receptor, partial [Cyclobacteriaceae bacterium]|nr:TonB-dependent receptor [Cyclobacteriaceae bacterium]
MYLESAKDNLIGAMFALVNDSEVSANEYFIEGAYAFKVNEKTAITPKVYYHYWKNKQLDGVLLPKGYYMIVPAMPPYIPQDFNGDGILEYWPEGALAVASEKEELYGIELKVETPLTDAGKFIGGIFFEETKVFDVVTKANIDPVYFFNLGTFMDVSDTRNFNAGGERTIYGSFAQVDWKLKDNLSAIIGARYDNYDDFGETFNPRCGLVWEFNKKGNVKFLYGSAFRAPTFGQLYNENQPVVMGNKDLKPEKIHTGEISLNYTPINKLNTVLTVFQSKIKDGIGMDVSGKILPTDPAIWGNVLELDSIGVETEAKYYLREKTYLYGSFAHIEAEKGNEDVAGIPQNSGSFGLNLNFAKHYNWNTMLYYVGEKPRDVVGGDMRDPVSSYTVVDTAFLIEDIIKGMDIKFIVKNLFDQEYYYPSSQATADITRPGISYYASVGYKF